MKTKIINSIVLLVIFTFTISISILAFENPWENDGSEVKVNILIDEISEVRFTENYLFNEYLDGHSGLYFSDGYKTRDRARDLWNHGGTFEIEKRRGRHAAFDIRSNTSIRVSIESFREDDLQKEEYGWISSPTLFAVADGDNNWATRAQIHRGGNLEDKLSDQFDILLGPGEYKNRFRIGGAVWLQFAEQFEPNKTYKMPLYITVSAE